MRRHIVLTLAVLAALSPVVASAQAAGNPIVTPPQEVRVTNTTVVQVPPMDPQAISDATVIADQSFIVNVVQPIPTDLANAMCSLPDIWRLTPPEWTYQQSTVRALAIASSGAGFAFIGLAVFARGLSMALGQGLQAGRLVFAAVMSASNVLWWEIGINLNNAISSAIGAPDLCGSLIRPHLNVVHMEPDPGQSLVQPVLVIVYAVVSLLLLVSLVFRLGMIDVLFAVGGLAMICWADEHTEYIAQWYARFSAGTVFGQVLVVFGLQVAGALTQLPNGGTAASIMAIVVILLCRRLPALLASSAAQSGGSRTGLLLSVMARRLVTRFL